MSQETIDQTLTRLQTFAKEQNPLADISPGSVLNELIVKFAATLHNPIFNQMDELGQASTVTKALASTTNTFDPIMDGVASNFGVVRNAGRAVTGIIKVTVTAKKSYFLDQSFLFQQAGINKAYGLSNSYTVDPNIVNPAFNQLKLLTSGSSFYFLIPVTATTIGALSQVTNGTQFILGTGSKLAEFVKAEAYGAFSSGQDVENDKELISRFQSGLATQNLISVNAISSVLKKEFPTFKDVSVVGANDAELTRAKDNLFGIGLPGMADVYVRTTESLETIGFVIQGTQITAGNNQGKWTLTIPIDSAPGFYSILSVVKDQSGALGSLVITDTNYSLQFPPSLENTNQVNSTLEGRFTIYQGCTIIFEYDGVSATDNFLVTVLYQPEIAEIQSVFLNSATRIPCADYLVKSAVPCNVTMHLNLYKKNANDAIPIDKIKQDIYTYINNIPFGADLNVSEIVDICHNYNIKKVDLPISVTGNIIYPVASGFNSVSFTGVDTLSIPTDITKGISPKTSTFFGNYFDNSGNEAIGITVF